MQQMPPEKKINIRFANYFDREPYFEEEVNSSINVIALKDVVQKRLESDATKKGNHRYIEYFEKWFLVVKESGEAETLKEFELSSGTLTLSEFGVKDEDVVLLEIPRDDREVASLLRSQNTELRAAQRKLHAEHMQLADKHTRLQTSSVFGFAGVITLVLIAMYVNQASNVAIIDQFEGRLEQRFAAILLTDQKTQFELDRLTMQRDVADEKRTLLRMAEEEKQNLLRKVAEEKRILLNKAEEEKQTLLRTAAEEKQTLLNKAEEEKQSLLSKAAEDMQALLSKVEVELQCPLHEVEQEDEASQRWMITRLFITIYEYKWSLMIGSILGILGLVLTVVLLDFIESQKKKRERS